MSNSEFYTLTTTIGLTKIANALAGGEVVRLTEMAVGDGADLPSQNQTALQSEKYRFIVQSIVQDSENTNWVKVEGFIPPQIGGFTIRELGVFDTDGDLIFIARHPEVYKPVLEEGSAIETLIRLVCQVSNADSVELSVDTSILYVTRPEFEAHNHDDRYSLISHSHPEYALVDHSHDNQYAPFGHVVTVANSNINGYFRIWSDGYKEQWGTIFNMGTSDKEVNFPTAFTDTDTITVNVTATTTGRSPDTSKNLGPYVFQITNSNFVLKGGPDTAIAGGIYGWSAKGY